jgi:thiamine kinase-like enzyme
MNRHKLSFFSDHLLIDYKDSNYLHYFNAQKILYPKIQMCKFVPTMKFLDYQIYVSLKGVSLDRLENISIIDKEKIKNDIIEFVNYLYKVGIAHRDLWIKNICWDGKQIWVIDWEYITEHHPKLLNEHYDITGKGEISPEQTYNMNLFHKDKNSLHNWLKPVILSKEDFKIPFLVNV